MRHAVRAAVLGLYVGAALAGSAPPPAAGAAGAQASPGRYNIVLRADANAAAVARDHEQAVGAQVLGVYSHALKGYAGRLSPSALQAIRADSRVLFVVPDKTVSAASQTLPRGVDRIDGEQSSTRSGNGSGSVDVNVAIIDTGIAASHPDLNVAGGVDCLQGKTSSGFEDQSGHGTHVAGIVAAKDNGIGVVGVAPGARIWGVRVLSKNGTGSLSGVVCGIDWVTATRSDSDPTNDIAVANMSLVSLGSVDDGNCGRTNADPEHLAICNSVEAGVVYSVAAGNDGVDFQNTAPAAYNEVLTVTALRDYDGQPGGSGAIPADCPSSNPVDDGYALFSNFATLSSDQAHTIAAPGVCILSTVAPGSEFGPNGELYQVLSGTSMAAPHVAGIVALCIAKKACRVTAEEATAKILHDAASYNTAHPAYGYLGDPLRPQGGSYYGYLVRAALY
jgi:subtilisin